MSRFVQLVLAHILQSSSTLRQSHGLKDISKGNSRIEDLRLQIGNAGTFQDFNDVVADLNRVCYIDRSTKRRVIRVLSAKSDKLRGVEMSLREILSRVPSIEDSYRMTFAEDAKTATITFRQDLNERRLFEIIVVDPELFGDRASLRQLVVRWRERFPLLKSWTVISAVHAYGDSYIHFRNEKNIGVDEFSEKRLVLNEGAFELSTKYSREPQLFSPFEALTSAASAYSGRNFLISPVNGHCVSQFSIHFLALFLLSSLVRYRPQTWMHALSRSVMPDAPSDDQAISLIERFLDENSDSLPQFVVRTLNPSRDDYA